MRARVLVAVLLLSVVLPACDDAASAPPASVGTDPSGDLLVFAAASLTDAFEELAAGFEDDHDDVEVILNVAGSQTLASQLLAGAPADVFAAADAAPVDAVASAGQVAERTTFATNRLAIAVEPGNPLGIRSLADLARDDVVLVLAAEEVPAGRYAALTLVSAGVAASPASLEVDVRAALGKVVLGEADAAIVYTSDIVAAGDSVAQVDVPDDHDVVASYPVATLADALNPVAADAFVAFLHSEPAQRVLRRHGFGAP